MKTIFLKTALILNFFIIEYLALTPHHIEILEDLWDKQNHFVAFFVLFILLSLAYQNLSTQAKIGLLLLVAFQIEISQYFIPGRFFSLLDIVADSIGMVIGIMVYRLFDAVCQIKGKQ